MPAVLLALVSGLACWIAFPPYGWWPVAPVGVAALAVAARGQRTPRALLLGAIGGLVTFVPLLSWSGTYVGKLPWFALATAESVFVALLGALLPAAWRVRGGPVATVAAVTGLWVKGEEDKALTSHKRGEPVKVDTGRRLAPPP